MSKRHEQPAEAEVSDEQRKDEPAATEQHAEQPAEASEEVAPEETELERLQRERTELEEQNLRLVAEIRNTRQRAERERVDALRYAEADFARDLLAVVDDLERAQQSAADGADAPAIADGVKIVYDHCLKVLRSRHIEPIPAAGEAFDPGVHEALLQQPSEEFPAGTVVQEVARGYKMHDRVIRPARVIVSSGPPAGGDASSAAADQSEDA